jgi:hypothetical protein
MVRLAVEEFKRKEAELKAIEEAPKVAVVTAPVSETPKDNTESERKEEHAE